MNHAPEIAIQTQGLCKNFRAYQKEAGFMGSIKSLFRRSYEMKNAIADFDLEIQSGEIVGLLGPNGAGKTTLMKMLTGIIVPSAGSIQVMGHTPHQRAREFRQRIALVMGQKSQLWWDIPAMDSFLLLQQYYEIEERDFKQRLGELTALMNVQDLLKVHVRKLSLGERMKMELMACLLHQPELIFLDEPTIGLDLVAQRNIRDFILTWQREHGATVLLTSHYMADVDALCERIVLVLGGQKRFDGSIQAFESVLGKQKFVSVEFEEPVDPDDALWQALDPQWSAHYKRVELRIDEERLRSTSIAILEKFPVSEFSTEKLPIERVMNELIANPHLAGPT